jgi:hypothetical protein
VTKKRAKLYYTSLFLAARSTKKIIEFNFHMFTFIRVLCTRQNRLPPKKPDLKFQNGDEKKIKPQAGVDRPPVALARK